MIRLAQVYRNEEGDWYFQVSKKYDLSIETTAWMNSPELGRVCMVPTVDIEESIIRCKSEEEAMFKMAEHYAKEYKLALHRQFMPTHAELEESKKNKTF